MKSKLHSSHQVPALGAHGNVRVLLSLIALFLPLFLSIQSAHAIRLQVPLEASATVTNAANASRVLVSFGSFEFLKNELVISARLHVPLVTDEALSGTSLELGPVDVPWVGGTPAWDMLWPAIDSPGFPDSLDSVGAFRKVIGSDDGRFGSSLDLDVTDLVREIAEGRLPANGFYLAPPSTIADEEEGFDAATASAFTGITQAKLEIRYRKISSLGIDAADLVRMKQKRARQIGE